MSKYLLYHKKNCQTSISTLKLLREKGIEPDLKLYLEDPPTEEELSALLDKLEGGNVMDLVRTKEPLYKEKYKDKKIAKSRWFKILHKNPILINRPILVKGKKAVICRPPENALELI